MEIRIKNVKMRPQQLHKKVSGPSVGRIVHTLTKKMKKRITMTPTRIYSSNVILILLLGIRETWKYVRLGNTAAVRDNYSFAVPCFSIFSARSVVP